MKLLKLLKQHPYSNDLHFFLIATLLLILGLKYYFILIILFIYLIFIFRKTKLIMPISIILLMFLFIVLGKKLINNNFKKDNYKGIITETSDNNYVIDSFLYKIKCYESKHEYKPGDIIEINIKLKEDIKSYEFDFDNQEYLYSLGINYSGNINKSKKIGFFPTLKTLKYYYQGYLKTYLAEDSYNYVSSLVFADNILNDELKDSYSALGISHILAISGMHIILLFNFLSFIMLKIFKSYHKKIPLIIISFYVILIGAPNSALRALLMLLLSSINKGRNKYTKLDILSISLLTMLFFNPYRLFNTGFILSYLISFILLFENDYNDSKYMLLKNYKRYLIIFLITLPFTIKMNNKIHLLSLLLSPILTILFSYTLIPISFLLIIFPILDYVFKYIYIFINFYTINLAKYDIFISIKTFNIYIMIIYYVLFSFLLYTLVIKKGRILSSSLLNMFFFIIIFIKYLNPYSSITFIDVGQGDSTLIRLPYNKGIMLIDCYNSFNYLKSEGINKIDYLVFTHSDNDHIGDYKKILNYFDVDKIIIPYYDEKFDELLISYNNITKVDYKYEINLNNFYFDILGPIYPYEDANSNSVVIKLKIYDYTFLFTGDMTKEEEEDLVYEYNSYLDSDVLKVGHHGSSTSSSELFLKYVTPKYSVISAGLNNKYGHPNKEIVERLNNYSIIYITYLCGNITFNILNNKLNISTYR